MATLGRARLQRAGEGILPSELSYAAQLLTRTSDRMVSEVRLRRMRRPARCKRALPGRTSGARPRLLQMLLQRVQPLQKRGFAFGWRSGAR